MSASESMDTKQDVAASEEEVKTIMVRFITKLEFDTSIADTPLSVPSNLARYGLSEIVNHLTQQSPARPFDFLVNGEFLRTTLALFAERRGLSSEHIIPLEIVEAQAPPESLPSQPHPDWVSAVDASHPDYILTACYDGVLRLLSAGTSASDAKDSSSSSLIGSVVASAPSATSLKACRWFVREEEESDEGNSPAFCVAAGKDRIPRVYKVAKSSSSSPIQLQHVAFGTSSAAAAAASSSDAAGATPAGVGHTESIEALAVNANPGKLQFISGGWDGQVLLWSVPSEVSDAKSPAAAAASSEQPGKKKRRVGAAGSAVDAVEAKALTPVSRFSAHSQCVSSISWPHPMAVYTGSWDHSIRLWDTHTGANTSTWHGSVPVTSLSFSIDANLLASGHSDRLVRCWDPRQGSKEVVKMSLKSHTGWVSGVSWSTVDAHTLVSVGYEGAAKLWDIRSSVPLATVAEAHADKALCVDFRPGHVSHSFVTGGADKQVRAHKFKPRVSPLLEKTVA